jgi:hypothetical protein
MKWRPTAVCVLVATLAALGQNGFRRVGQSYHYFSTVGCPTLPAVCAGGWAFR